MINYCNRQGMEVTGKHTDVSFFAERTTCIPSRYRVYTSRDKRSYIGTYSATRLWELFNPILSPCQCPHRAVFCCSDWARCHSPRGSKFEVGQMFVHKESKTLAHITRVIETGSGSIVYCISNDGPHTYSDSEIYKKYDVVANMRESADAYYRERDAKVED